MRRLITSAAAAAILLTASAGAVAAHVEVVSSFPAAGEVVSTPPSVVAITFDDEIGEDGTFTVTDEAGNEVGTGSVDLEVADRNVLRGDVRITGMGEYTVTWAVTALDGDPVEGSFTFTYFRRGGALPGTAIPGPSPAPPSPATAVGILLVAIGGALHVRRLARHG